jgi:hypothetical protein
MVFLLPWCSLYSIESARARRAGTFNPEGFLLTRAYHALVRYPRGLDRLPRCCPRGDVLLRQAAFRRAVLE